MFYQLSSGRVIEITIEQYFELTDEEIQYLIAYNYGEHQENPFFGSIISSNQRIIEDVEDEDIQPDIIDVPEIDKLIDLDVDYDDIEEE